MAKTMAQFTAENPVIKGEVVIADKRREIAATEEGMVDGLRANAARAIEIEADLLEKASRITDDREVSQALRAVSDVKSKSVDNLLKLTGRAPDAPQDDTMAMLRGMAQKGYLRINVGLNLNDSQAGDGP